MKEEDLKKIVQDAYELANNYESNLPFEVLMMTGMSGSKNRHILNNLVRMTPNARYLEIGCWRGSTTVSALYENNPEYHAIIDDFSEFPNPDTKNILMENCKKYLGKEPNFMEVDCFNIDPVANGIKDINIYLFDGLHSANSHFLSIVNYYNSLADNFILVVDDWSWPNVQKGTVAGLKAARISVSYAIQPGAPPVARDPAPPHDPINWWNGYLVAVCKKDQF